MRLNHQLDRLHWLEDFIRSPFRHRWQESQILPPVVDQLAGALSTASRSPKPGNRRKGLDPLTAGPTEQLVNRHT